MKCINFKIREVGGLLYDLKLRLHRKTSEKMSNAYVSGYYREQENF